jgi:hypothetical protein
MFKKIALGGIFVLASVLTTASATSAASSANADHGSKLTVPHAPIAQGMCGAWGCR